jgi:hypothetical protein
MAQVACVECFEGAVELAESFDVAQPARTEIVGGRSVRRAAPAIDLSIIEGERQQPQAGRANRKERESSFDEHR